MTDPGLIGRTGDITLASYQAAAERYATGGAVGPSAIQDFLGRFVALVGPGARVLELGSGPGEDARRLEEQGLLVDRTDGTPAFVAMMRADGCSATLLDLRTDELPPGPHDAVLADAVLLHLSREEFAPILGRAARVAGLFAFSLKEGDGDGWSTAKLDLPRYFTYWREEQLRAALDASPWDVVDLVRAAGRRDDWLFVLARRR